jgi:hypothetical protein
MSQDIRVFKLANIDIVKGMKKRSKYTKVDPDSEFHAKTPSQAASKAFIRFCKINSKKLGECKIKLGVKEKNKDKVFEYALERKHETQTVVINGKEVTYKYKVIKKSVK